LHNNLTNVVKGLDVYTFVDMGEVFSTFPARTALYSAGFGLSWTPHASVTFEGSVGVPWKQVVGRSGARLPNLLPQRVPAAAAGSVGAASKRRLMSQTKEKRMSAIATKHLVRLGRRGCW